MKQQLVGATAEVHEELLGPPEVVRVQLGLAREEVEALAHARHEQSLIDAWDEDEENRNRRG
jgi:hypothetical protein